MARVINWFPAGTDFETPPLVLLDAAKVSAKVLRGMQGLTMPTWAILTDTMPGVDGSQFREAVIQSRVMSVPVWVQADSRDEFRAIKRQLALDFFPENGAGKLEVQEGVGTPSGDRRYVNCTYLGGMEGDEGTNVQGSIWWAFTLRLVAHDPYAYGSLPTVGEWAGYPPVPFYPILPLQLSRSDVNNIVPLVLRTDKAAYPVWDFKGPFTRVKVENLTTGEVLELVRTTVGSETVRIITEPGKVSIRETSQDIRVYPLSDTSELFSIDNRDAIKVTVDNANLTTLIRCTVHPKFLILT